MNTGFVIVYDDKSAVFRSTKCKFSEGFLQIFEILEVIQMILFNIQYYCDSRMKIQEGIIVLAGLHNNGVAFAYPVAGIRPEKRQGPSDHDCRVLLRSHHDMGCHGSGRSLAMGPGNAYSVFVVLGDRAPGLGPLKNRYSEFPGCNYLRVLVMNCGCPYKEIQILAYVLRPVADIDMYAHVHQMSHIAAQIHVASGNADPHAEQYFRE